MRNQLPCKDPINATRSVTCCCPVGSRFGSRVRNCAPQTGISSEPCEAKLLPKFSTAETYPLGYFPSYLLVSVVRSDGGDLICEATGPSPLPPFPWQDAQYFMKVSLPAARSGFLAGGFVFCWAPTVHNATASKPDAHALRADQPLFPRVRGESQRMKTYNNTRPTKSGAPARILSEGRPTHNSARNIGRDSRK